MSDENEKKRLSRVQKTGAVAPFARLNVCASSDLVSEKHAHLEERLVGGVASGVGALSLLVVLKSL